MNRPISNGLASPFQLIQAGLVRIGASGTAGSIFKVEMQTQQLMGCLALSRPKPFLSPTLARIEDAWYPKVEPGVGEETSLIG